MRVPDDPFGVAATLVALEAPALQRSIAALRETPNARSKAVAWLLADLEHSGAALSQLAQQNDDPALYRLALGACASSDPSDADCGRLLAQTFVQLDPDNAVAWLELARDRRRAGDVAGEQAAMQRVAASHRVENDAYSILAYSDASLPTDLSDFERYQLAVSLIGIEAVIGPQSYSEASRYCSKSAVSDPVVLGQCRGIADLLDANGSNLLELAIARSIGTRVGWSPQRIEASSQYSEALEAGLPRVEPAERAAQWSCGAIRAQSRYVDELSRTGEVQALRDRLERSGDNVRERASQYHQYIDAMIRQATAAAGIEGEPVRDPQ